MNRFPEWSRRDFLRCTGLAGLRLRLALERRQATACRFLWNSVSPDPTSRLRKYIGSGNDDYICEREAALAESLLEGLRQSPSLPLAPDFNGSSPLPGPVCGYRQ